MLMAAFETGPQIAEQERARRQGRPPLCGPVLEGAARNDGHADRFVPLLERAVARTGRADEIPNTPTGAGRQQMRAQ